MTATRLPVFDRFIKDLRQAWAELPDIEARMKQGAKLLEELVKDPVFREHSQAWPSTEGRRNLLLYEDPDYQFAINGVVRIPGRVGRIHDHACAWTAYGVLDGTEKLERFRRLDDGKKEGYARLELESETVGVPGKVDLVPPYGIHAEHGGPPGLWRLFCAPNELPGKQRRAATTSKSRQ